MKNQRIFPGVIFIGVGAYFFLQQSGFSIGKQFFTWPTLLIIVGIAFLGQGYWEKEYESILPGVIFLGFGLHFQFLNRYPFWANHVGSFVLIIALGYLLRYQKTHSGLFQATLFFILAMFLLFYDNMTAYFGLLQSKVSIIWKFWPLLIMAIGAYFLFKRKK